MKANKTHGFYNIHPGVLLSAVETLGLKPTGRYVQLNSYENRVFDLEFENHGADIKSLMPIVKSTSQRFNLVIKVYRPLRWSWKAIKEEHQFLEELARNDIPAVAPVSIEGETLFSYQGMFFCLFPKALGRMPQELIGKEMTEVGLQLAKLHNIGSHFKVRARPVINTKAYGEDNFIEIENFIYPEVRQAYYQVAEEILDFLDESLNFDSFITLHGDCHKGNILQTDPKDGRKEYFFVDFDDFCVGPSVQDFWMLLSQTEVKNNPELDLLLQGYESLRQFDEQSLKLIPALQGLRIIHYAGWIAKRWSDPSFKNLFPQYLEYNYWVDELRALEECYRRLSC